MFFSILNMVDTVNSPFISTLWRDFEKHEILETHIFPSYKELFNAVRDGISLVINDSPEYFNIVNFKPKKLTVMLWKRKKSFFPENL